MHDDHGGASVLACVCACVYVWKGRGGGDTTTKPLTNRSKLHGGASCFSPDDFYSHASSRMTIDTVYSFVAVV